VLIAWLWYRVREFRYFVACSSLGGAALQSAARARSIGFIYLVFVVLAYLLPALVFSGLAMLLAYTKTDTRMGGDSLELMQLIPLTMIVAIFLGHNLASSLWLQPRLLRHLCTTTMIANPAVLDQVAQSTVNRPRFGEGLADSFGIG
jgi:hypothetical protein